MNVVDNLNGIINVLKPPGMTSHDVIAFIRRTLQVKKAGHTGTLDPGVAGVLPVCLGKSTRIIEYIPDAVKGYRAEITFGSSTASQDSFGQILETKDASQLTPEQAAAAISAWQGEHQQTPPMVSAVKLQGKKLYELARQGIEVERKSRPIKVLKVNIISSVGFGTANPRMLFDILCSRGTYVRTICHDVGQELGCGGFMSFLVRTQSGVFHLSNAVLLQEIAGLYASGDIQRIVHPIEKVLPFPEVWVTPEAVKYVTHGNLIRRDWVEETKGELQADCLVKVMNKDEGCLAVAVVRQDNFQPVKVLC